ncbi:MAG: hypothetical protein GXY38_04350 [Planctomycetes bacterium]|jgi:hypothetical protein|nr:hypothetical protein [Planctomycetota bacterium]
MKFTLVVSLVVAALAVGCTPTGGMLARQGLEYRLHSVRDEYFEYQPLDLVLVIQNSPDRERALPVADEGGKVLIRKCLDNDPVGWEFRPVTISGAPQALAAGQTLYARLGDPTGHVRLPGVGQWIVSYDFHEADAPKAPPVVSTRGLYLRAVKQPLVIPVSTPQVVQELLTELSASPPRIFVSNFPAWTEMVVTPTMQAIEAQGDAAVDALLANLEHYALQPLIIQMLADMRAERATPYLEALLLKRGQGLQVERLIITALGRITRNPEVFNIYSRWPHEEARKQAAEVFDSRR